MVAVVSDRYPYLNLFYQVSSYGGQVWAMVDTGFEGDLCLPLSTVNQMGRPHFAHSLELADGSVVNAPAYYGVLQLIGMSSPTACIIVAMGDEPILGRGVIDELRVTFDHGHRLIVEA